MKAIGQEFFAANLTTSVFSLGSTGNGLPPRASRAVVQAQAQPLRYWLNGVSPTGTVGMVLPVNETLYLDGEQMQDFRGINDAAGTIVAVQYYGRET